MAKNFNLDAKRITNLLQFQDTELQLGLLNGMIDQTIHHHVVESNDNDEYDRLILRGGKILDKYAPSEKKPLMQKVSDILYLEHDDKKKYYQTVVDSETAFLPVLSTFKDTIIDFTALEPQAPVVLEAPATAA